MNRFTHSFQPWLGRESFTEKFMALPYLTRQILYGDVFFFYHKSFHMTVKISLHIHVCFVIRK